MKYYIRVKDGQVIEGPKAMPSGETESPNIHWGKEQLKLNGILVADVETSDSEFIDFQGYTFSNDTLTIPKKLKPIEEYKSQLKDQFIREMYSNISSRYPIQYQIFVLNGFITDASLYNYIDALMVEWQKLKEDISNSTTLQDLKGIKAQWPE